MSPFLSPFLRWQDTATLCPCPSDAWLVGWGRVPSWLDLLSPALSHGERSTDKSADHKPYQRNRKRRPCHCNERQVTCAIAQQNGSCQAHAHAYRDRCDEHPLRTDPSRAAGRLPKRLGALRAQVLLRPIFGHSVYPFVCVRGGSYPYQTQTRRIVTGSSADRRFLHRPAPANPPSGRSPPAAGRGIGGGGGERPPGRPLRSCQTRAKPCRNRRPGRLG